MADVWEIEDILMKQEEDMNAQDEEPKSWRKYAKLILPHIGLILLSTAYILTGAAVFYHLEKPYEMTVRSSNLRLISQQKNNLLDMIWRVSKVKTIAADKNDPQIGATWDLENLTRILFDAFDTHYVEAAHLIINLNQSDMSQYDYWTYNAAVFFSSTLLTTIGYGNLVPVTFEGRVFCICYGLLGVPLVLITVTDIGKFLAEHITAVYGNYSRWKKRMKMRYAQFKRRRIRQQLPADAKKGVTCEDNNDLERLMVDDDRLHLSAAKQLNGVAMDDYVIESQGEDSDSFVVLASEASVPTPIILSILLGYMILGAWLLTYVEQWPFFDAFYFAFISLTTIGFGDFVPENNSYYVYDMLYIVIGLSITTMCIDLVGAQYIEKIHNFGRAIKDARYALINVGGKMIQVRDLMKYSALLHRKYGLTEARARQLEKKSSFRKFPQAFTPREIKLIRYIDYVVSKEDVKTLDGDESWRGSAHDSESLPSDSLDLLNADFLVRKNNKRSQNFKPPLSSNGRTKLGIFV